MRARNKGLFNVLVRSVDLFNFSYALYWNLRTPEHFVVVGKYNTRIIKLNSNEVKYLCKQ